MNRGRGSPAVRSLPNPSPTRIGLLTTDGPIFRVDGQPWRWKGVSAFRLCRRFTDGENIDGFLDDYRGFNVLRVWDYVTWDPPYGWESCGVSKWIAFLDYVAARGWFVELTLLTDDDRGRLDFARFLILAMRDARVRNVLFEAGNEPTTHKAIETAALRSTLDRSGFLYSSGDYEDSARFFGSFGTAHTGRDADWPRRAHDLLEYYQGGGPNTPADPAHKVPWIADEPIKPSEAGGNREQDVLAYFAACSLLGAGATFHCESGKQATRPSDEEKRFAAIALQGLNAFPADAPKGSYTRPDEHGATLRTYTVGGHTVRIRPTDGQVLP